MGVLGRRFAGAGAPALRRALTRALADEWFGHYNYWLVARMVRGHRSPDLVRLLVERSERAWSRADRLARRLQELGGRPPLKVGELLESATDKPFKLPKDLSDADALLRAVLDAERTSARTFEELRRSAERAGDALTRRLAEEFLAQAVSAEQDLEQLLGESAPEMDGR